MSVELIERAEFERHVELREAAVHESSHAHIALKSGCRITELYVRGDASGMTTYRRPPSITLAQRAQIALAGACASHRFYQPDRRAGRKTDRVTDHLSDGDRELLETVAREASPDFMRQADWLWRQVAETQRLVAREWIPIKRLAREVIDRGGVYLIETAPQPVPRPKPPLNPARDPRLLAAMKILWGGDNPIYP